MRYLLTILATFVIHTASAQLSGLYYYADTPLGGPIELLLKKDGSFEERNNTVSGPVFYRGTYTYNKLGRGLLYLYQERMLFGEMRNTKRIDHYRFDGDDLQRLDLDLLYVKYSQTPANLKEDNWTVKELLELDK